MRLWHGYIAVRVARSTLPLFFGNGCRAVRYRNVRLIAFLNIARAGLILAHCMDGMPDDVVRLFLGLAVDYLPVIRAVCVRWRGLCPARGALELTVLASRGHSNLLIWILRLRGRPYSAETTNQLMAFAAEGGHEALVQLIKAWGATSFDWAMAKAGEGGYETLVRLTKDWGATNFSGAIAYAAGRGHEVLMRLAKDWGATDFDLAMAKAARGGHEALMRLAKDW